MKALNPGDRIKINPKFADVLAAHPHFRVGWPARRSVVHHTNFHAVFVLCGHISHSG
jgi:hypothetical protein